LRNESERVPRGERDTGDARQLVGDLGCGVARADDDDLFARVRSGVPVVGDVREVGGEARLAREGWPVGIRE
jgi:hypothetical protein